MKREPLIQGLKNPKFLAFILFFSLTVLSSAFSSNVPEALFSLEVKMAFVLFPFLVFCFQWPVDILRRCIISFVSGCFFACTYLIIRSILYALNGQPEYFFYTKFSDFIHASYFAMYLVLAIILIIIFYFDWFKTQKNIQVSSYVFISVFIVTIFLCSSKLGLISFIICLPLTVFYYFKHFLNRKRIFFFIASFFLIMVLIGLFFPGLFSRFNSVTSLSVNKIDKNSIESSRVRVLIWNEALQLVKTHFWFGTGVGDANDALYHAYEENGLTGAFEHKFNAHNQFFQTFIGMGIFGFLSLLYLTLGKLISGIKSANFLLFIFSLLIILNFVVESMLQTAAGVLFFTFFACFFDLIREQDLKQTTSPIR